MRLTSLLFAVWLAAAGSYAQAVEVAPRISDREIIEALTELKAGQRALAEQMDQRFAAVDQRFDSLEKRLEFMQNLMLALIAGIFGLIGFVVWDRYKDFHLL